MNFFGRVVHDNKEKVHNKLLFILIVNKNLLLWKLDGVGPVDNRPSTD